MAFEFGISACLQVQVRLSVPLIFTNWMPCNSVWSIRACSSIWKQETMSVLLLWASYDACLAQKHQLRTCGRCCLKNPRGEGDWRTNDFPQTLDFCAKQRSMGWKQEHRAKDHVHLDLVVHLRKQHLEVAYKSTSQRTTRMKKSKRIGCGSWQRWSLENCVQMQRQSEVQRSWLCARRCMDDPKPVQRRNLRRRSKEEKSSLPVWHCPCSSIDTGLRSGSVNIWDNRSQMAATADTKVFCIKPVQTLVEKLQPILWCSRTPISLGVNRNY